MPRLKVYEAEIDGLHQWVVAAPNQRAALDAFGVHQDLFARGLARVTEDEAALEAAGRRPLTPLRREKGSKGAFEPVATGSAAWQKAAATAPKAAGKKPPSRAKLDRAETALARFEEEAEREREEITRARADLEAREAALDQRQSDRRRTLTLAMEQARRAYRAAGGR